jgi:hypothetical protein
LNRSKTKVRLNESHFIKTTYRKQTLVGALVGAGVTGALVGRLVGALVGAEVTGALVGPYRAIQKQTR